MKPSTAELAKSGSKLARIMSAISAFGSQPRARLCAIQSRHSGESRVVGFIVSFLGPGAECSFMTTLYQVSPRRTRPVPEPGARLSRAEFCRWSRAGRKRRFSVRCVTNERRRLDLLFAGRNRALPRRKLGAEEIC